MNETGYIPRTLDKQEKFLLWDIDQFIIAILLIGVGVTIGALISGMVAGSVAAWQYGRLKAGKHPKFATHSLYWWLPSGLFVKTAVTPPSYRRYFLG